MNPQRRLDLGVIVKKLDAIARTVQDFRDDVDTIKDGEADDVQDALQEAYDGLDNAYEEITGAIEAINEASK
jgi:hypothetical protein